MPNRLSLPLLLTFLCVSASLRETSPATEFEWIDTPGKHTDLLCDGRNILRYVYEPIDTSSPERREATFKPFHHLYDAAGRDFLTKGPGGKYTHHRGIYYGFSKCSYVDASGETQSGIDTWHCRDAYQLHQEVLIQEGVEDHAVQAVTIAWHDKAGAVFATEERQLLVRVDENTSGIQVDFQSILTPVHGPVTVDGDPQHAGFHFRASNEVAESTAKETYYIRPGTGKGEPGATINWKKGDPKDDPALVDLPWKAMSFVTGGERYTALYLDSPSNPKPAVHSERDYGRFGSFFVAEATKENPLAVRYRLHIVKGELTPEECAALVVAFE